MNTEVFVMRIHERLNKQEDIAELYAAAMAEDQDLIPASFWREVNDAIRSRWSVTGLKNVKRRAWVIYKARKGAEVSA